MLQRIPLTSWVHSTSQNLPAAQFSFFLFLIFFLNYKKLFYLFIFIFINFYWSVVALQCHISFLIESVIGIHISPFFSISFAFRSPQSIEWCAQCVCSKTECNWQTTNLKNIQSTPTAQFQKNKWPNQKMGQRTK